jgi:hypothetical protein
MKKIICGVLCFCLVNSAASFAINNSDETCARINEIHLENQQLHHEIQQLRSELHSIKRKSTTPAKRWCCNDWPKESFRKPSNTKEKDCENLGKETETGFARNSHNNKFIKMWKSPRNLVLLAAAGVTVTASPFLGLRSAFDASDLIVNLPTMNEDLRFLKQAVEFQKKLNCYGLQLPDRPMIVLGGKIEGIVFAQEGWGAEDPTLGDIDIGSARLDILVKVSRGVHAFMALNMDSAPYNLLNNSSLDIHLRGSGSRILNSRVYVSRAFITLGELSCSPLYFTIGQMFVPFGRYASNMVTTVLTTALARTNQRAILFGLYEKGLYGSLYFYPGDTNVGKSGIDEAGINIGYEKTFDKGSLNIGGGYIFNIADSTGMQDTGA